MIRALSFFLFVVSANAYILNEEECLNYTVYPVQYELTIYPHIYKDQRFHYDCELTITVIANAPNVRIIELDAKDLIIKSGTIRVLDGEVDIINVHRPYEYDQKRGKIYIYLRESLQQYSVSKKQYYIKISFGKFVKYESTGVFVVKYDDGGPKYMIMTRLSPDKAKYFFPCFDNPQFEAIYKFRVHESPPHPSLQYTNTSLVIAKEQRRNTLKDNYVVIDFIPSSQVALYQVGFHYSKFGYRQVIAKNTNDTLVIWAPPTTLSHYNYILEFGESILNLIHEYSTVNRPLVYGPINIVSVPTNLHGYEIGSWNLLTNGDTRLAYLLHYTSIKQIERMQFELAQQLSRIWLGNPGELERTRWKEEWFKEGVATYLAYYLLAQYNNGVHTIKQRWPIDTYAIHMKHKAMAVDWHHSTPALATFNRTLAVEIPSRYKELVTMKTASILWMVENWIGSEKFHQALVKYINSRRGKYISVEDFTTNLDLDTVECLHQFFNGSTASKVLKSWFHRPGYPVVKVRVFRDRQPDAIQLGQTQFSFTQRNRLDSNYLIPISYVVQNNHNCFNCYQPRFTIGMQTYTFEENLNGGWIILNRNASGYYRVDYDLVTWKLIAKTLKEDQLSIDQLNRAQIVNDVFALYVAGDMDYELAMEILDYLDNERSYTVWEAAITGFELLKTEGASCDMSRALYEQWQEFMSRKVAAIYNRLINDVGQHPKTRLFRSRIMELACTVNHQPCMNSLRQMFNGYKQGRNKLDPDARETCYYIQLNENGDLGSEKLNRFEQDDAVIAEHRLREENRFLYRVPVGSPRPMPIMMSTSPMPIISTEQSTLATNKPSSSTRNLFSVVSFAILTVIFAAVR